MKYLKTFESYTEDEKNIDDMLDKANNRGGISKLSKDELELLKNNGKVKDDMKDKGDIRGYIDKDDSRKELKFFLDTTNKSYPDNTTEDEKVYQIFTDLQNEIIKKSKTKNLKAVDLTLKLKEIRKELFNIYYVTNIDDLPDIAKYAYSKLEGLVHNIISDIDQN